jgi:hypothetical protein
MPKFYVDFSCWEVVAKDNEDAFNKAREILENSAKLKQYPAVSNIEEHKLPPDQENKIELE